MRIFKRKRLYFWLLASGFWLLASCSQKKNTFTSRTFHNLTAHYNGLYWANVNLEEAIVNIEKGHKDDYSKLLPVFKYADEKAAKANYPQLDKAIEKTNKMIQYHSMLINGREYCRWIDDNYMTMGMSHFYKRDYYAALLVFDYVVKMFSDNPTKYDAFLWIVRTNNQMNSVIKTGPILDVLKHDSKLPKRLRGDYFSVLSDYYIRTEEYKKAVDALKKTIPFTKKKNVRARYIYILAQLYEQEGNLEKASQFYSSCATLHPSYEMEFNARLSKARTFQVENGEGTKDLKKELTKMLKDEKNKDFRDQVYYALGDISARENDIPAAINLFKSSARSSVGNVQQKALSFLRIADIYFDQRSYKLSGSYYDSTMAFLSKDYKNYEQVKNKKESLASLIKNINIIDREDSLLNIARMDTASISKLIAGIISKVTTDEAKKKEELEQKKNQPKSASIPDNLSGLPNAGSWYFYNQATMSSGFADFFRKWGNRQLEDNWRRSSKQQVMAEQQEADTPPSSLTDTSGGSKKTPPAQTEEYYLKNIPFSDEQKTKANEKILEAYYNLGSIYKEDLDDDQKAEETFEALLKHYPDSKYTLNLYYQLYRLYLADKEQGKANFYKDKILNEYPDSEYAKIIKNPDYQRQMMASQNEIEIFYTETYSAYRSGKYDNVLAMVDKADSFYSKSELMPKFALLRAFSIGKTKSMSDYENALQGVIAKYPKDPAKTKARELLDHLKEMQKAPVDSAVLKKDTAVYKSPYTFKDSAEHQCMIIISSKKVNVNDFQIKVSNFNSEYYRLAGLSVSNLLMDLDHQLFIVKSFPLSGKAKDYYDFINQDSVVFKGVSPQDYQIFPISTDNFSIFYKDKNDKKIDEYRNFFLDNYFRKKEK
ncbi:MAG: tetratricopeptide repeat protein [Bacteroidetes bacterium]|nr:tetratricopeptide repeat protein [Bacteroidota bacterium]